MSRCCLTVGLFLGLLARSVLPPGRGGSSAGRRSQRRAAGGAGRAAGDARSQFRRGPQGHRRGGQGQGCARRLPGLSAGLVASPGEAARPGDRRPGEVREGLSPKRVAAPRPLCQGPGHGRQGRLPRRPGDLRTRGEVSALRSAAAAIGGRLPGVRRRAVPAPPRRINSPTTRARGSSMPWPWIRAWRPSNARKSSSASAIVCRNWACQPKRQRPMRNSLRHMPTTRGRWKPATGWANASWPPASCRKRERPGGNC